VACVHTQQHGDNITFEVLPQDSDDFDGHEFLAFNQGIVATDRISLSSIFEPIIRG
jgi:hypothetical protein